MLINCPECELQVSDKAISCPHCGYPINQKKISHRTTKRRPKLPNGFGQISEIKTGNLRKPFRVMVTVGKTEYGKPICKLLQPEGFFKTYNEAYAALLEYNKNPYDVENIITIKDLYDKWSAEHFKKVSKDRVDQITSAWLYCSSLYNTNIREIRTGHIRECILNARGVVKNVEKEATAHTKQNMKILFSLMFKYAMQYDLIDRNYAESVDLSALTKEISENRKSHIPYTEDEMELFWKNVDDIPILDIVLIQCYSGWRPRELCKLKIKDVDLENGIFVGGMKTTAGKERIVPIHPKIKDLVKRRYSIAESVGSEYLFVVPYKSDDTKYKSLTYGTFRYAYTLAKNKLNINPEHTPHDGRKHFITMAKNFDVDEYAIKYIVGHQIKDLTERVYTERQTTWLIKEMKKIK